MKRGILVMAYGTPRSLDEVERYYTDIRRGRRPTPQLLAELTARYEAIGGRSPLLEITDAQARGLAARIPGTTAFVGHKHAPPSIAEAVRAMAHAGIEEAVGLVMAPHYSSMSVGDYYKRAQEASLASRWHGRLTMVESWHLEPAYIEWLAARVVEAHDDLASDARADATVFFTAHSLPSQIVAAGDPYPEQLHETAKAVAERAGVDRWEVSWQSAGRTEVPWLGPDVTESLRELAARGGSAAVVCPCGFVADHLEILYDLDIEVASLARELGIDFARTRAPNDDPVFLDGLAVVVRNAFDALDQSDG